MNPPLSDPPTMEQVGEITGVPESEQEVSELANPVPDTWTVVPGLAEVGLNVIDGVEFTVKDAVAESPFWSPVAVTV